MAPREQRSRPGTDPCTIRVAARGGLSVRQAVNFMDIGDLSGVVVPVIVEPRANVHGLYLPVTRPEPGPDPCRGQPSLPADKERARRRGQQLCRNGSEGEASYRSDALVPDRQQVRGPPTGCLQKHLGWSPDRDVAFHGCSFGKDASSPTQVELRVCRLLCFHLVERSLGLGGKVFRSELTAPRRINDAQREDPRWRAKVEE